MDGINVTLFLGKLGKVPNRECFYFVEGANLIVIYVSEKSLPEAKKLWGKMLKRAHG